jgi:hypothetical protein
MMMDMKYTIAVVSWMAIIYHVYLVICVYTFNSSIRIKAVNVIVTMLANESLKDIKANKMITEPYNNEN